MNCLECKWSNDAGSCQDITCRFNPPTCVENFHHRFPIVSSRDWCRKFERRDGSKSPEERVLEYCLKYAVTIATNIVKSHYPENNVWKPLNDLPGVLSQIDNAVCGLERKKD